MEHGGAEQQPQGSDMNITPAADQTHKDAFAVSVLRCVHFPCVTLQVERTSIPRICSEQIKMTSAT